MSSCVYGVLVKPPPEGETLLTGWRADWARAEAGSPSPNGETKSDTITATWSSSPGHYALRSTISNAASLTVMGDRFQRAKQSRIPAPPMR
jgi:hypothetical protein